MIAINRLLLYRLYYLNEMLFLYMYHIIRFNMCGQHFDLEDTSRKLFGTYMDVNTSCTTVLCCARPLLFCYRSLTDDYCTRIIPLIITSSSRR